MRHELIIHVEDKLSGIKTRFDCVAKTVHEDIPKSTSHYEAVAGGLMAAGEEYSARISGPSIQDCVEVDGMIFYMREASPFPNMEIEELDDGYPGDWWMCLLVLAAIMGAVAIILPLIP